jgi:hypothetical protein
MDIDQPERERLSHEAYSHKNFPRSWKDVHAVEDLADVCEWRIHYLSFFANRPGSFTTPGDREELESLLSRAVTLFGIFIDSPPRGPISRQDERRCLLELLAKARHAPEATRDARNGRG